MIRMSLALTGLFLLLTFGPAVSQVPAGYYDPASGKTGAELKTALHNIINDHTRYPYTSSSTDVWDILMDTDEDTTNPNNVILIYTGRSQDKSLNASIGNDPDYWNREHVWAKSHGFPNESDTAYTDVHHLRPCDASVNSSRSNKDFDNGGDPQGEAPDTYTDSDSWEPRDAVKGDVARMMFYMATRYEGDGDYDLELQESIPSSGPRFAKLATLIQWHNQDPVDNWERIRNDKIYYNWQHNRNPFIDHPEYVDMIWGSGGAPKAEPSNHPTNFLATGNGLNIDLSWTDATGTVLPDNYLIKASDAGYAAIVNPVDGTEETTDADLSDGTGVVTVAYGQESYTFSNLNPNTRYYFKIYSSTNTGTDIDYKTDGTIQQADAQTGQGGGGTATEIFISEYVEGDSYNKYIELYNGTGTTIDLSVYDIQIYYNGNTTAGSTIPLSGTVASGATYVIAHSSATAWSGTPNLTSGSLTFNGNDVVELRKNGSRLDIIGTVGDASNLFQDKTLQRKSSVTSPSATYSSAEWNELALTYSGLGSHFIDEALPVTLQSFTVGLEQGAVQLNWETASEINNAGFIIERADAGLSNFMVIADHRSDASLKGAGTSSTISSYLYTDFEADVQKSYVYRLKDSSYDGTVSLLAQSAFEGQVTAITDPDNRPQSFRLEGNYPNPFNPRTTILLSVQKPVLLSVAIYDVRGRIVRHLFRGVAGSGTMQLFWDARDDRGHLLGSGAYLYRVQSSTEMQTGKMLLLR
ncbi:MAG TPA: T9SS type A sorting domain-containing protein [Caldithrix abyssi]|uniref:T9SS type A sorting domain-containing protein n=1 Tax=Caldithrix abyssi TaxID=187145 RepID=A0A7V1PW09_CALAY|nr:T9SS type A sorting domain-containing protein [Caldithrix abyssi]